MQGGADERSRSAVLLLPTLSRSRHRAERVYEKAASSLLLQALQRTEGEKRTTHQRSSSSCLPAACCCYLCCYLLLCSLLLLPAALLSVSVALLGCTLSPPPFTSTSLTTCLTAVLDSHPVCPPHPLRSGSAGKQSSPWIPTGWERSCLHYARVRRISLLRSLQCSRACLRLRDERS